MSALPQKRKAVDARRALPHSQHPFNHLLLGEVLSEGKGRPAPVVITRLAPAPAYGSAPRSRSVASGPDRRYTPAIRLVATCDDGAVAGDPASTFRTAVGTLVAPHGHPPQSPRRRHFTDREDWRIREFQHAWRRSEPWIRTYDRLGRTNWPSSH